MVNGQWSSWSRAALSESHNSKAIMGGALTLASSSGGGRGGGGEMGGGSGSIPLTFNDTHFFWPGDDYGSTGGGGGGVAADYINSSNKMNTPPYWDDIYYNGSSSLSRSFDSGPNSVWNNVTAPPVWNVSTYLNQMWGPRQLPIEIAVPITIVYVSPVAISIMARPSF